MTPEAVENLIKRVLNRHLDPKKSLIFLFGSRASASPFPTSDYDIGLYQGGKIPLALLAKIENELEEQPIPVDVDLVDFAVATDEFKKLALKQIKVWNRPKKNLKLT